MRPEEIVRVFPLDLIKKCVAKVSAYQRKHSGVRGLDIALEIIGVGRIGENGERLSWIEQLDLSRLVNQRFKVEKDPELPAKTKNIPILPPETEVFDLVAKECLSDEVMKMVLTKKFGPDPNVVVFDASTLGVTVDGSVSADTSNIRRAMEGLSTEMVLFPVNCNNNHWCSIVVNLAKGKVYIYDSSSFSYLLGVRAVAHTLIPLLPATVQRSLRVQTYESGLGVQTDSYNCGVYVLIAFEMFCGAEPLGHLDKKTL
ncbi:hypothetical protein ON010_g9351 [Phytophthora cinnamomi]|nr:hypothetical protein ON010_g9351 [Phytophthora cinnamomi]